MNELPHGPWEKGYEPSGYSTNQVSAYPEVVNELLQPQKTINLDWWEAFRRETAVKVLIAMLQRGKDDIYPDPEETPVMAVYYTDMLIEALKEQ